MPDDSGTRMGCRQSPGQDQQDTSPKKWTSTNKEWLNEWKQSLIYPATGKNRTTVDKDDIYRLDEGELLNDNLINFYLRYLQVTFGHNNPELPNMVHIFSTFFIEKLQSTKSKINYDGVKNWTSKIDLFTFDYVVVPVNENAHWYFSIVCNLPRAVQGQDEINESDEDMGRPADSMSPGVITVERDVSDCSLSETLTNRRGTRQQTTGKPQKQDPSRPRILTLDSLGFQHSLTCKHLREYLIEEAKEKKNIALTMAPSDPTATGIPEQDNDSDCGLFLLGYFEQFLKAPVEAVRKLLMKEEIGWVVDAPKLRSKIRNLLFGLQAEQNSRLVRERIEGRKPKKQSTQQARSSKPSPLHPVTSSPLPTIQHSVPESLSGANHKKVARDSTEKTMGSGRNLNDSNVQQIFDMLGERITADEARETPKQNNFDVGDAIFTLGGGPVRNSNHAKRKAAG